MSSNATGSVFGVRGLMTKALKMLDACPEQNQQVGACEVRSFLPLPGTVRFACQGNDSLAREDHGVLWLSLEEGDSRRVLHA